MYADGNAICQQNKMRAINSAKCEHRRGFYRLRNSIITNSSEIKLSFTIQSTCGVFLYSAVGRVI